MVLTFGRMKHTLLVSSTIYRMAFSYKFLKVLSQKTKTQKLYKLPVAL